MERSAGEPPTLAEVESRMRSDGLSPRSWGNGPGDTYGWHDHEYHKVLYCVSGSIVFHTRTDGDVELHAGLTASLPNSVAAGCLRTR